MNFLMNFIILSPYFIKELMSLLIIFIPKEEITALFIINLSASFPFYSAYNAAPVTTILSESILSIIFTLL